MAEASKEVEQNDKRKQFGNRLLTDPKNVFEHNAWDNVVWDDVQENDARSKTEEQLAHPASIEDIEKYEADANKYWNKFYGLHDNKFFKDRHWLFTEFPELAPESYLSPENLSKLSYDISNKTESSVGHKTESSIGHMTESSVGHKTESSVGHETESSVGHKTETYSSQSHPGSCAHSHTQHENTQDLSNNCHSVETVSEKFSLASLGNSTPASLGNCSPASLGNCCPASLGNCSPTSSDSSALCISGGIGKDKEINKEVSKVDESPRRKEHFPGEMAKYRMFEVGCGVGNTVFPILQANNDPDVMVYCCDYSSTAIDLVKVYDKFLDAIVVNLVSRFLDLPVIENYSAFDASQFPAEQPLLQEHGNTDIKGNEDYDERRCHAFVCDISEPDTTVPFPDESLDVIILIFILSANNPDKFQAIINRLSSFLRPGGMILFRDYGRYDLAQLRFKKGKCLRENFYVRGDGTRVYFFTQDELREMMGKAGLVEKQNLVDRRLQVNRGKQLKMYRVWIQCKYIKPLQTEAIDERR